MRDDGGRRGRLAVAVVVAVALLGAATAGCGESAPGFRHIAVANPEDLIALPGSELVIVSRMAQHGEGGGAIVAIDRRSGEASRVFPTSDAPAGRPPGGSTCAGPPDPVTFAPHGIVLVPGARLELYVVNHGGREAVEMLALSHDAGKLRGAWVDCIPLPEGAIGNAVAVAGETVFVTNNGRALDAEQADIRATDVLMWSAEGGWRQAAPRRFPVPNGLVAAPDGERIHVAVWIGSELVELQPGSAGSQPRRLALPFMPDNVRLDSDGALLVAGQDATEELITECYYGARSPCPARSAIARVDPQTMELICHRSFPATDRFGGATVAAPVGEDLWLGQSHGEAILVVPRLSPPGPDGGC